MIQKVIQVGNSLAITIPKAFAEEVGLTAGGKVFVKQFPQSEAFFVSTHEETVNQTIDPETVRLLNQAKEKYADALKKLAKL